MVAFTWTQAASGEASSQAKAAAEAQFDEGIALMKSGDLPAACSRLESSQRVEPAIGTLLYLGECYARMGRTASAWATFREAASLAGAAEQLERAKQARIRAAELEPRLAYVKIVVPEAILNLKGLSVLRDGDAIDRSLLGTNLPVDPGSTRLEVRAPGYESYISTIDVVPTSRTTADVPLLRAAVPGAGALPVEGADTVLLSKRTDSLVAPRETDNVPNDTGSTQRTVGLLVGGAGLVGIGVGSYFGLSAMSRNSDAESGYCNAEICQRAADLEKANAARRDATISTVAFAAGGATVVTGMLLYWLAPRAATAGWTARPQIAQHSLTLAIEGPL